MIRQLRTLPLSSGEENLEFVAPDAELRFCRGIPVPKGPGRLVELLADEVENRI